MTELLSVSAAAARHKVTRQALYGAIARGSLFVVPVTGVGPRQHFLLSAADVAAYFAKAAKYRGSNGR